MVRGEAIVTATSRKSYVVYRMMHLPMTSSDLTWKITSCFKRFFLYPYLGTCSMY